jgi:hypothetical protein
MKKSKRLPDQAQQQLLDEVRVELAIPAQTPQIHKLLNQHHYLGSLRPVGERLYYIARDAAGQWVAVLVFSAAKLNGQLPQIQRVVRGPAPREIVVMDGKEPNHGSGASILTAVTAPSQNYLGGALVDQKTNEIPVAQQELIPTLDLAGHFVSLDALPTQDETARTVVLEAGGHYLLTVKDNPPTPRANIEKKAAAPPADFSP